MTPSPPDATKGPSFEDALSELEQILRLLESGDATLEEGLASYEIGVGLLKRCYGQLRQAEQRVYLLCGEDPDGKPLLQPFEHTPAANTERQDASRRKRPDSAY